MEYVCAGNSPVQSPAGTENLQHNKVEMSQLDGQLEKTAVHDATFANSECPLLPQRDSCSPTLIMEVVEVEKESQEEEEKEGAANMAEVSSFRCGKVIRGRELREVCSWTEL